jgi:uncharacterized protein (DUF1697 family)
MHEMTFIALLRGINVGGKVLKMADLKAAVAGLDFSAVQTYLQSGNLVFRAPTSGSDDYSAQITSAIRTHAGMDVHVLTRSAAEWEAMIRSNPFADAADTMPKSLHAFALASEPDQSRLDALISGDFGNEYWQIASGTLYLHTPPAHAGRIWKVEARRLDRTAAQSGHDRAQLVDSDGAQGSGCFVWRLTPRRARTAPGMP